MSTTILKQFFRNPRTTGAICASSPGLCRALTAEIDLERAAVIAELGPGTGVVTRQILADKADDAAFFAVELNPSAVAHLRETMPELNLFHDSASNLRPIMEKLSFSKIDAIISGLPWASFPSELQELILSAIVDVLPPGGHFTTFAYLQGTILPAGIRFRRRLSRYFSCVKKSEIIWGNIPPAFVYRCIK